MGPTPAMIEQFQERKRQQLDEICEHRDYLETCQSRSFTVATDDDEEIELMADSEADRDLWVEGLQHMIAMASKPDEDIQADEPEPEFTDSTAEASDVQVWLRQHGLRAI